VRRKLVITTAATVPLAYYKKLVPGARFIRAMPNIATLVWESFTAFCCDADVTHKDRALAEQVLICSEYLWRWRRSTWMPSLLLVEAVPGTSQ